jgi:hypothetical protein
MATIAATEGVLLSLKNGFQLPEIFLLFLEVLET